MPNEVTPNDLVMSGQPSAHREKNGASRLHRLNAVFDGEQACHSCCFERPVRSAGIRQSVPGAEAGSLLRVSAGTRERSIAARRCVSVNTAHPGVKRRVLELSPRRRHTAIADDPDTGLRLFKSIEKYELDITRAAFTGGSDPFRYLEAFNACLFLSANPADVTDALEKGVPAGLVFPSEFIDDDDDDSDNELRIAFDFDGVLADDSAEVVFRQQSLVGFLESEKQNAGVPMPFGPLHRFFVEIAKIQKRERARCEEQAPKRGRTRIAIVTARGAPAHERVVTTLRSWGMQIDEAFSWAEWRRRKC